MAARVMILAGGTGGHVYPALAVAEELRARGCDVTWMGTRAGLEARVVPAAGLPIDWLSVSGFRGKGLLSQFLAPVRVLRAVFQAWRIVRRRRPNVVLGMGGFVAGPGGLVAWLMRIPLVIHEQNRIPGTTNRMLVKCARFVLQAFPDSFSPVVRANFVGNPLRQNIVESARSLSRVDPVPGSRLRILVLGGSQGALALNQVVPEALAGLSAEVSIRHQTGEASCEATRDLYRDFVADAEVVPFIHDMAEAYRRADLVICRSGAMTLSELTANGLPSILIPYPYAIDDHQTRNAEYLVEAGAAILIQQAEATPTALKTLLQDLIAHPETLARMAQAARSIARLDATREVADILLRENGQ